MSTDTKILVVSCLHYGDVADAIWTNGDIVEKIRRRSTHRARGQACVTAANTHEVDLFVDLGDKIEGGTGTPWDYLDDTNTDIANLTNGIEYATVWGNHEGISILSTDYPAYYTAVEAAGNHVTKGNFVVGTTPQAYTFEINGIGFVVYGTAFVNQDYYDWLTARLAAYESAGTPVVILSHKLLCAPDGIEAYAYTADHAAVRTIIENSDATVLGVFCGHYHRASIEDRNETINSIDYYAFGGSVFAPRADDNTYYIAHINSAGTIRIDGYGKGGKYAVA